MTSPTRAKRRPSAPLRCITLISGLFLLLMGALAGLATVARVHGLSKSSAAATPGGNGDAPPLRGVPLPPSLSSGETHRRMGSSSSGDAEGFLFKPAAFRTDEYVNLPVKPDSAEIEARVVKAMANTPDEPYGLMHEAHPPGRNVIMGLAAYPRNMDGFRNVVGSLRTAGYDGHLIFGVHANIPEDEQEFLKKMDVTYYAVEMVSCDQSIMDAGEFGGAIRGKCSKGLEKLKLEWGRFEMARQWLHACAECTGWALVMDTRDIFFQAGPFASLGDPGTARRDLLFVEEIAPHTNPKAAEQPHRAVPVGNGNKRYRDHTEACYGKDHWRDYADRAVLCSGTVIGTREGMHRFLSVLVDEFYANNAKANPKCRSPHTTDQWTMDYMYYNGMFGRPARTATIPWGMGPVLTIGTPCINEAIKHTPETPKHSQKDLVEFDSRGHILNNHEPEGSPARIAPAVHQYDRCHRWVKQWMTDHKEIFGMDVPVDRVKPVPWLDKGQVANSKIA